MIKMFVNRGWETEIGLLRKYLAYMFLDPGVRRGDEAGYRETAVR